MGKKLLSESRFPKLLKTLKTGVRECSRWNGRRLRPRQVRYQAALRPDSQSDDLTAFGATPIQRMTSSHLRAHIIRRAVIAVFLNGHFGHGSEAVLSKIRNSGCDAATVDVGMRLLPVADEVSACSLGVLSVASYSPLIELQKRGPSPTAESLRSVSRSRNGIASHQRYRRGARPRRTLPASFL